MADAADLKSAARKGVPVRVRPPVKIQTDALSLARPFARFPMHSPLVLASASPRRAQLLTALGVPFSVEPSLAVEPPPASDDARDPGAFVRRLARLKAQAIQSESLIVAADTVVVWNDQILGKPRDENHARAMLKNLRGQTHQVYTGVCVARGDKFQTAHEITSVTFGDFSDAFIEAYVATGEPLDKAGAYGAQEKGALLVAKIEGDYWNVVGLPLFLLSRMLREWDILIEGFWTDLVAITGK